MQIGIGEKSFAGGLEIRALEHHQPSGFQDANPLSENTDDFPAPEMLYDVDRKYFVHGVVLERRERVQVAQHVGPLARPGLRDVDVDIAGQDLVATAEVEFQIALARGLISSNWNFT